MMKRVLRLSFYLLVSTASVAVLVFAGFIAYAKVQESLVTRVDNPEIRLSPLNHWQSGDKIIFTAIAKNESSHEWLNVSINFIVKRPDGSFIRRCPVVLMNKPFKKGSIDLEADCNDMPSDLTDYKFEVKMFGEY